MKNVLLVLLISILISCKNENQEDFGKKEETSQTEFKSGETLFTENNCAACHKVDQKVVGPSLLEIATIYKEKNGDMVAFLKEEAEPIVDETMYETMKINLQVTKTMSNEELKALEDYIISFAK
jgi:cytochrome c